MAKGLARNKDAHYDEPIIIDNSEAFVSVLPDDEEDYFIDPENAPKSTAIMWGHKPFKWIKVSGTDQDQKAYPLKANWVRIDFYNVKNSLAVDAGKMRIEWLDESGVVAFRSEDAETASEDKRLRWKKFRRVDDLGDRLGLIRRYGNNHSYTIKSVTFEGKTAISNAPKVEIRLCTEKNYDTCK